MKKIIYIGFVLMLFGLSSCSDEWIADVIPTDKIIADKSLVTINDGVLAVNGIFSLMQDEDYYGANYIMYGDLKAMDFRAFSNGKRGEGLYTYSGTTDASKSYMWVLPYKCLLNINNALENILKMDVSGNAKDVKLKGELMGNLYALRALAHFDLLKIFSVFPTAGNPKTDLGVVLVTKVVEKNFYAERSTVAEVYTQIIADLKEAEKMSADVKTTGWFTLDAVKALLARVYLYNGDKVNALIYAKQVIDGKNYSLTTYDDYLDSWKSSFNNSEAILTIINTDEDSSDKEGIGYLMNKDGYSAIITTKSFQALLKSDVNDIRSSLIGKDGFLKKYPGLISNNLHIIRLAEMYLIAAEAAPSQSEAMEFLNVLLDKRTNGKTKIVDPTLVTLDRILIERRKELAGEGHTFFDYMRNKKNIVHVGDDHLKSLKLKDVVFEWNDYRAIQPIPRIELDSNPLITQNPEYLSK